MTTTLLDMLHEKILATTRYDEVDVVRVSPFIYELLQEQLEEVVHIDSYTEDSKGKMYISGVPIEPDGELTPFEFD